jgi:hypothetical protein
MIVHTKDGRTIRVPVESSEPDSVSAGIGRTRKFVAGQLGDIRQFLDGDLRKANAEMEKHVTAIRMVAGDRFEPSVPFRILLRGERDL